MTRFAAVLRVMANINHNTGIWHPTALDAIAPKSGGLD